MAFKQVFYALREVFPQVDIRILKAVASQYSSDVDAAVEFVLSDVLPAVSEPTEAHYTLQDIDCGKHDHTDSAGSSVIPIESEPSPVYVGPICTNNKMEECSQVEDKAVINETRTAPTTDYVQSGSSSMSAAEPHITEYKQPGPGAFVSNYCVNTEGKMIPRAENTGNSKHFDENYELPDLFASSGSVLQLFMQNSSDWHMKNDGKTHLKFSEAESIHGLSKSEGNHYLEGTFETFHSTEVGQSTEKLPNVPTVHMEDYGALQGLFGEEVPLKLTKAEGMHDLSKSEDHCKFETSFANFCSIEDRDATKNISSAPLVRTHSKAEDNCDMQILSETIQSSGKELDVLHSAENTPDLQKSENDDYFYNLFGKLSIANEQPLYEVDNQCNSSKSFASSKITNNSLQIFKEKGNSHSADSKEQPSADFENPRIFTTCNLNDDFILSELFSSTQNVLMSDPDSKCEVGDKNVRDNLFSNTVDQHSISLIIEHDSFLLNGVKVMPSADKSVEFPDISTQSNHITEINKFICDFTKSKDALSSLYDSTTIKMKEVELQEENSRQAKQDSVKAHQDFLDMLEHYNQLIENSKESNDKQAKVVREEKDSLAALAQDLQSHIIKLSAQRDEALTIVEEIKFDLDAQLSTSMEEETAAREQISQYENLALLACKGNEATMERIMEESSKLQKEAKENILLKGLLLDRGHIIDTLQGEISSIHAKVVALKERTSDRKLDSTLLTTSCLGTSHVDDCRSTSTDRNRSLGNVNENGQPQEDMEKCRANHATSSDDEWELLERIHASAGV